ncbi:GntR family transcriptional regulator [Bradyrhizobium sp. AUGA SZCCT0182]|uniref:GntR family transcriptional regulator n=1 Tax=Bradyrhizobium sp. AUGA SZCCT0182 TaxID=2807667 RepID=UPI001BA8EAAD|nr:GntR family transcriptional regulator [Bradyrhizobium sp. AUGA SZCCT0182]MBR1237657.1 GntR family transcriptional regulator [Bradyrhizobium sp. AUGA SZCCT0182]
MTSLIGMTLREAFELGARNIEDLDQVAEVLLSALRRDEVTATANEYCEEHIDENGAHCLQRKAEARLEPRFWDLAKPNWLYNQARRPAFPGENLPAAIATGIWLRRRDIEAFGWTTVSVPEAGQPESARPNEAKPVRPSNPRRRGPPAIVRNRVKDAMRDYGLGKLAGLTEEAMAAQFGASRTTCRDALADLKSEIVTD